MELKEKEIKTLENLQPLQQSIIEKYGKCATEAKDEQLKSLFQDLLQKVTKHQQTLDQALNGTVEDCDCNDASGKEYCPTATYTDGTESEEKKEDCFLVSDCIGTEKLVSSEYNASVFQFDCSQLRKLIADMMIESQNHAMMLYKYKIVNGMS